MAALRFYVPVPFGQLHGRRDGDGAPVLLLHASPMSAASLTGQSAALAAAGFQAIALDTPGYGQSDPLPEAPTSLVRYAQALADAMTALGHDRFALYGTATGSQIALQLARLHPQRVSRLVVDNCALFTPDDVAAWEPHYFPDLSPTADGSHLADAWRVASRQFVAFPWFSQAPEHQLNRPAPPVEAVQAMAMHFLSARPSYDTAYRLAFHAENAGSFAGLTVPTVLVDWAGSIVAAQVKALIAQGLPACVQVVEAGPTLDARFAALVEALR
jgi:pimeloyl-ACP methyl ester carboxylesterase